MNTAVISAIEPMVPADFDEVLRLWHQTEGVGLSESDTPANLAPYLERNPSMSFVAREGGTIVGAVLCGHDGRRGYLHHLAVDKQCRRRGLGTQLVNACLDRLATLGILKCNIFLYAENAEGKLFWDNHGWKTRGDLQVLQKTLG